MLNLVNGRPVLYIIRGLPGSGKSTLANQLTLHVCEADQFFIDSDGVYRYDANKIREAHDWCKAKAEIFMRDGYEHIAIANTFTRRWEFEPYEKMAIVWGYSVIEITLSGTLHGNTHDVPEETVQLMRERWEK